MPKYRTIATDPEPMTVHDSGVYDLEERTFNFARAIADFVKTLPKTITNREYVPQLIKASSSVGANYIETNESLGKKDFLMRIRISRKESKESRFWLRLIDVADNAQEQERQKHIDEATQLMKIFGSIVTKVKGRIDTF